LSDIILSELALVAIRHNTLKSYAPTPAASPRWRNPSLIFGEELGGRALIVRSLCRKACLISPDGSYWSMSALLSPVQDGKIWRVKIVWPNQAVHHVGKFTSEQDAIDWINAHPNLTPEEFTD
jgi:hypothetical protein